jgi:hypothetical protein
MRGNKSPEPPAGSAPRGGVLNPKRATPLIKYVGKSTTTLKQRMQQYKTPGPSQSTNIENNANIKKELEAGKFVEIYAFVDSGLFSSYGGFRINLAEGLETSIIEDVKPEWNKK